MRYTPHQRHDTNPRPPITRKNCPHAPCCTIGVISKRCPFLQMARLVRKLNVMLNMPDSYGVASYDRDDTDMDM